MCEKAVRMAGEGLGAFVGELLGCERSYLNQFIGEFRQGVENSGGAQKLASKLGASAPIAAKIGDQKFLQVGRCWCSYRCGT